MSLNDIIVLFGLIDDEQMKVFYNYAHMLGFGWLACIWLM